MVPANDRYSPPAVARGRRGSWRGRGGSRACSEPSATQPAAAAARALGPGKVPFLVTSANSPKVLSPTRAPTTYLLRGTPYQEALAAAHWLALRGVQHLAVVAEDTPESAFLVDKLTYIASPVPRLVSQQTIPPGLPDARRAATAALASKPDIVYWAGSAEGGGRLVAALRRAGFKGTFLASAQSESTPSSPPRVRTPTARSSSRPHARSNWRAAGPGRRVHRRLRPPAGRDAMHAYDAVRALAQAVTQAGRSTARRNSAELPASTSSSPTLLGVLQFARDHTIQEDDHVVLVVRNGAFRTAHTLRSNSG